MKKIKFLTNYEYVKKHYPNMCNDQCGGGIEGCPREYSLDMPCCICDCIYCYSQLSKKNGKYVVEVINNEA